MTLYSPTTGIPHQGRLLASMQNDLQAFIAQHSGSAYVAQSASASLFLLASGAGQFVLTIHLANDQAVYTGPRIPDPVVLTSIAVRILCNKGIEYDADATAVEDRQGQKALLWIVSQVRKRILSYNIASDIVNNGQMYYRGMQPLALPTGEPLHGYELTFDCHMLMDLETEDKRKRIDLP